MESSTDSDEESTCSDLILDISETTRYALENLTIAALLCPIETSNIEKLQNELKTLKEKRQNLEDELQKVKRKRWCRWCLQEAIFHISKDKFYCSTKCEQLDVLLAK